MYTYVYVRAMLYMLLNQIVVQGGSKVYTLSSRVLVRAVSYTIHGLIPASCVFADRYNREEVVASLGREINLNPPLTLGQLPDTSDELLKLDQVYVKTLKAPVESLTREKCDFQTAF